MSGHKIILFLILPLALWLVEAGYAWENKKPVTPYGDYCPRCSQYGKCKDTMSHDEAKRALIDYYRKKGLGVQLEHKRGRFIKAKIRDKDKIVDVIIFDRRTGRIRSIY